MTPSAPEPGTRRAHTRRDRSRRSSSTHAPVGEHQLDRLDLGRQVPEPRPGAVRRGRDRPGERLAVDVALVLHREAVRRQRLGELADHDPGLDPDEAGRAVDVEHAVQPLEPEHRPVRAGDVGERVAGPGGSHAPAGSRGAADRVDAARRGSRPLDHRRRAALIAGPVSPLGALPENNEGRGPGGVAERFNAAALKTLTGLTPVRGFESLPLRFASFSSSSKRA